MTALPPTFVLRLRASYAFVHDIIFAAAFNILCKREETGRHPFLVLFFVLSCLLNPNNVRLPVFLPKKGPSQLEHLWSCYGRTERKLGGGRSLQWGTREEKRRGRGIMCPMHWPRLTDCLTDWLTSRCLARWLGGWQTRWANLADKEALNIS